MWFKQVQIYSLSESIPYQPEQLGERFTPLAFRPCLPTLPMTQGWVPPVSVDSFDDSVSLATTEMIPSSGVLSGEGVTINGVQSIVEEDAIMDEQESIAASIPALVYGLQGYQLFCMQIEEKVLPPIVVQQTLAERVAIMATERDSPVSPREKRSLKEAIILDLLPKSFSKRSKVYGYIDTQQGWLILDTASRTKAEQFVTLFKRSYPQVDCYPLATQSLPPLLTRWLLHQDIPTDFMIEKACLLKDPNQQNRQIRCQNQDLSASPIIDLMKAGCQVHELALSWRDQIEFVLGSDMTLKSLRYQDAVLNEAREALDETPAQRFAADFAIMSDALSQLLTELYAAVAKQEPSSRRVADPLLAAA